MPSCPKCNNLVDTEAIRCPHCDNLLKAYGHPGVDLYQATGETFLCDRCLYHEDDSCTFPKRPYAKTCTLFCDRENSLTKDPNAFVYQQSGWVRLKTWCFRNRAILLLLIIVVVSVAIALN
ncbi:zinc ribbon domain-containing protein [Lusitaniella coriacea]|uniref:zinc ribbon domain-containing protein n=1 Tax=Lusitaniella coriacea TaxID=1983105 RepID=UPI003CEF69D2